MKSYILILAAILLRNEAKIPSTAVVREQRAVADIARLIHIVNHQNSDDGVDLNERSQPSPLSFSEDYFMFRTASPTLKEIVKLIQADNQAHSVRLHIIKNPSVLEEYKKRIHSKYYQSSDENGDKDNNNLYNLDRRRNALFRLGSSFIENALREKEDESNMVANRPENSKHDKRNEKNRYNVDEYVDNDAVFKKGREDDRQDNAWDVITKNYEWDEPKREHSTKKNIVDDWVKVTKRNFDDLDRKTTKKRGRGDRMVEPKKMEWYSAERKPKKKDFGLSYEKKSKKKAAKTNFAATKQWKIESNVNRNKPYVPKIPKYYEKPRKKPRDPYEGGKFGRTPIPYVGRQGIYAD